MHKKLSLFFCLVFSLQSFAAQEPMPMEIDEPALQQTKSNPFDLITDDNIIRQIADWLDDQSCGHLRACDKRLSMAAWPSDKIFHIKMELEPLEADSHFWQKVLKKLRLLDANIQKCKAHNDIVLHLPNVDGGFNLPKKLARIKNLAGLMMDYFWNDNHNLICLKLQMANHKKLFSMMPNLKYILLPRSRNTKYLASMLSPLQKLQSIEVQGYYFDPDDAQEFLSIPSSVKTLKLQDCTIWGMPAMERFKSLRELHLIETNCQQTVRQPWQDTFIETWEVIPDSFEVLLRPLAAFLEKLNLRRDGIKALPSCLAAFKNLQELDISLNHLSPEALACITGLPHLRWINLAGNEKCESQKDLIRRMFPPTVTIAYDYTYDDVI